MLDVLVAEDATEFAPKATPSATETVAFLPKATPSSALEVTDATEPIAMESVAAAPSLL